MRKYLLFSLFIAAVSAVAYQTGSVSRPNFSAQPAAQAETEETTDSAVPGQKAVQTRSFTSYSARQGSAWRQGVQTKTVQTKTAGAAFKDDGDKAAKNASAALKKEVPDSSSKPAAPAAKAQPTAASTQPATANANADPAAMMQQLQGLQNMMGAFGGAQGGAQNGGKGGPAASVPSMPGGMPDMSALMNMAGQSNVGKK